MWSELCRKNYVILTTNTRSIQFNVIFEHSLPQLYKTLLIRIFRFSPFSKNTFSLNHKDFLSNISVQVDTLPYIRMDIIKFYFILEADKVQVAQAFKSLKRKTSKIIFDHLFQIKMKLFYLVEQNGDRT